MAVWYSLLSFGIFFPCWYVWTEKNLATLADKLVDWEKNLHPDIFFSRRFIVQKKAQEVILAKNADVMLNAQTIGASRRVAKKIKISFSFFLSLSLQTLFPLCAA
jgi:c-di-AMP phosphodiesterase-like protein